MNEELRNERQESVLVVVVLMTLMIDAASKCNATQTICYNFE